MAKKTVLITGASAGFGYDTSKALAERGHRVYATMRDIRGKNKEKAQELVSWAEAKQAALQVVELDVTQPASIERAAADLTKSSQLDVLINNAGVGSWGIDEAYTVEQAEKIFQTNLFGVMRMNHAFLPHMRQRSSGLVIYISSGLGRIILPYMAIYTASKFAIEAYAECTAYELAPLGVQTVIVQPGAYGTTFLSNSIRPEKNIVQEYGASGKIFEAFSGNFEKRAAEGGLGNPQEIVDAIVEEVEREAKDRPMRRTVGRDVQEGVVAINKVCAEVQGHLLAAMGIKH